MCGITGFTGKKDKYTLQTMVRTISHRGPDDEGFYFDENINLGMRRLSIIDLTTGHQPMTNETKDVWVVLNGEIYNFLELQNELKESGHKFSSQSDTECVIHLYEEFGLNFPQKLNGMFGIALWDSTKKRLVLARDRVGIKPLYYYLKNNQLIFGSEIKAILAHPQYKKEINFESLHHFLSLKHTPAPNTIFKDIYSLLPGEILIFENSKINKKRYWQLSFKENKQLTEKEATQKILELLTDAVKLHMRSDVKVGAYLSGGIDSSSVVALMTRFTDKPIDTFCLGYKDNFANKSSDLEAARKSSKLYQTKHHEYIMSWQEIPACLDQVIQAFDEPYGGVISTYFISQLIKKNVKVTLSGDGGDELFGSYLSHRIAQPMVDYLNSKQEATLADLSPRDRKILLQIVHQQPWCWRSKLSVFNEDEKKDLSTGEFKSELEKDKFNTPDLWKKYFQMTTSCDILNQVLEAEFKTIFPDQILAFADRLSMAHSIELRPPFLDYRLIEYVATIPGNLKIKNGVVKYILKKSVKDLLPEEIINRPKEGFVLPINSWLHNQLQTYVKGILLPQRIARHGFFNQKLVKNLIRYYYNQRYTDHSSPQFINHSNKIWLLLMFQLWWEECLK